MPEKEKKKRGTDTFNDSLTQLAPPLSKINPDVESIQRAIFEEYARHELLPILAEVQNSYVEQITLESTITIEGNRATLLWNNELQYQYKISLEINFDRNRIIVTSGQKGTNDDSYCHYCTIPYSYKTWEWEKQVQSVILHILRKGLATVGGC